MRLRWRPARMSLATKCRVLFGIAAVLIIGAALFVQFQRMEQLTRQLNLSAGRAVARLEVARHVAHMNASYDAPIALPAPATTMPTSMPSHLDFGLQQLVAPRLLGQSTLATLPAESFERQALDRFVRRADRSEFAQLVASPQGNVFSYAEPLTLGQSCVRCHVQADQSALVTASSMPTSTQPTVASRAPLFGIVSVQIPNQIPIVQIILNRVFLVAAGLLSGLLAIVILSFVISRLILRPVRILQESTLR